MTLTIYAGTDKDGNAEKFESIKLKSGAIYAVCGNTGAGKSQLIKDIEMLANRDTLSKRKVVIAGSKKSNGFKNTGLIAHLGQSMRFVLDISVAEFIEMHLACRNNTDVKIADVLALANTVTRETVRGSDNLLALSGGQSRALMISDIALVCDSPIVLIDEIENAGVDKTAALNALVGKNKLVIIVTHDPHTMLLASKRIIIKGGGISKVVTRTETELKTLKKLSEQVAYFEILKEKLRNGENI